MSPLGMKFPGPTRLIFRYTRGVGYVWARGHKRTCRQQVDPGQRALDLAEVGDVHQSPSSMIASWMRSSPAVR